MLASSQEAVLEDSGPHLSDRILNYRIEVELDPLEKKVTGHEILTWRNQSGQALRDFCFHLYLNAFKNNRSTFIRESSSRPLWDGIEEIPDDYWGYTNVESIQVISDEESVRPQVIKREYIHPDDDNEMDRTVLRIELDQPLPAGEEIKFRIDFESRLPKGTRRTGWAEDYFFVAQWFPKIGVVQEGQWNCHQYHQSTEYFADFGVYDVSFTVPTHFVVGATGKRVDQRDNGDGTTTYRYLQ
ncbi:MAG: M1 family peptidase, partial [Acidobacteria bacterium]|nr:M1 family peptidase [Acidobacteriota bacterium]